MSISLKSNSLAQICFFILLAAYVSVARARLRTRKRQAAPDVLVLSDGDTLHGKLVKEVGGKVTFHTDSLGDVDVPWDKIKELHASGQLRRAGEGREAAWTEGCRAASRSGSWKWKTRR